MRIPVSQLTEPQIAKAYAKKSSNAHSLGHAFSLTFAEFRDLYSTIRCPVFGMPLMKTIGEPGIQPDEATVDRLDNKKGYVSGNVMLISYRANTIKALFENPGYHTTLKEIADFGCWLRWRGIA